MACLRVMADDDTSIDLLAYLRLMKDDNGCATILSEAMLLVLQWLRASEEY